MNGETIGERLEAEWHQIRSHLPHHHYADTSAPAAPEDNMSLLDTVETEIHNLADHAKRIEQEILPTAITGAKDIEQLAASPAGQALLAAAHVPADAIEAAVVPLINWLSRAYTAEQAAAPADTATGQPQPEPAPAQ